MRLLYKVLKLDQRALKQFVKKVLKKNGYRPILRDGYIYAEGTTPIGLVAHLDTVFNQPNYIFENDGVLTAKDGLGADDRAGVYSILHLINNGYRPTVIMLEDEEVGGVGAKKFVRDYKEIPVNFLLELDRQDVDDAVFYDCGNIEFQSYICEFGFTLNYGSFSDISILAPHFDLGAVNLSIGYFGQHTKKEMLVVGAMLKTIKKVESILLDDCDERFDHQEVRFQRYYGRYSGTTVKITKASGTSKYATYGREASAFYDEYEDMEYYYDELYQEEAEKLAEETLAKYDLLDSVEADGSSHWSSKVNVDTMLPLTDCIVNLVDGTLIDTNYSPDWYLSEYDEVYHFDLGYVANAVVLDYSWYELSYDRIVASMNWRQYNRGGWKDED